MLPKLLLCLQKRSVIFIGIEWVLSVLKKEMNACCERIVIFLSIRKHLIKIKKKNTNQGARSLGKFRTLGA